MKFVLNNIRTLLTLKFTAVFAFLLLAYTAINILFLYNYLSHQLDLNLKEDLEIIVELLIQKDVELPPTIDTTTHIAKPYERFVEIYSDSLKLLYRSSAFNDAIVFPISFKDGYSEEPAFFSYTLADGSQWRMIAVKLKSHHYNRIVRISMSKEHITEQMKEFFTFMSIIAPIFLIIGGLSGYILARQSLAPIDKMAAQAKKIGAKNLKERIPVINSNDELGNFAAVTNDLLDRLQYSFEQLKNFTSDASHEFRTPLTVMRSVGEVGLQKGKSSEYYREVIGSMLEENTRLTHLVDSLLLLSRADAGRLELKKEKFDVLEFCRECVEIISILAEEKKQSISISGIKNIFVVADKTLLRQALLNLIDNAIKYTPVGSHINITVELKTEKTVAVNVTDTGGGISKEHQEKIFDRFYRINKDRSRETEGVGLGLAIVQWIMNIHNGTVSLQSSSHGSAFTLILPAESA